MLKMVAHNPRTGRSVLICGLSHINLDRLKQGQPIKIDGAAIELPIDLVIFAGETEQSMARELAEFVGQNTRVNIDKKVTDA